MLWGGIYNTLGLCQGGGLAFDGRVGRTADDKYQVVENDAPISTWKSKISRSFRNYNFRFRVMQNFEKVFKSNFCHRAKFRKAKKMHLSRAMLTLL